MAWIRALTALQSLRCYVENSFRPETESDDPHNALDSFINEPDNSATAPDFDEDHVSEITEDEDEPPPAFEAWVPPIVHAMQNGAVTTACSNACNSRSVLLPMNTSGTRRSL